MQHRWRRQRQATGAAERRVSGCGRVLADVLVFVINRRSFGLEHSPASA
jgi:hypothetical protein